MITKIFEGPKKIVEEQLAAYTSSLNTFFSICLTTTTESKLHDNLSKAMCMTIIVRHPKIDLI